MKPRLTITKNLELIEKWLPLSKKSSWKNWLFGTWVATPWEPIASETLRWHPPYRGGCANVWFDLVCVAYGTSLQNHKQTFRFRLLSNFLLGTLWGCYSNTCTWVTLLACVLFTACKWFWSPKEDHHLTHRILEVGNNTCPISTWCVWLLEQGEKYGILF